MNRGKKIGTRGETRVVQYLNENGIEAERRALSGSADKGDIIVRPEGSDPFAIEVKSGKQTANPSRMQIEEWLRQAKAEADNSDMSCLLCIVRYRRSIADADVYWQVGKMRKHFWLSELIGFLK